MSARLSIYEVTGAELSVYEAHRAFNWPVITIETAQNYKQVNYQQSKNKKQYCE